MSLSINLDTTALKTSRPIIADGHLCKVRFANASEFPSDKGIPGPNGKVGGIALEYHLLDPAPTVEGTQVKPGFPLFERIYFYGKDTPEGQMPERAQTTIAKRTDAFLGTGDPGNQKGKPSRPPFNNETVAAMIGKEAYVKVKAKVGGDNEGNDIQSVTFPGDLKA